jgi:drug/metabolite transporter (DMT)-like permease
MMAAMPAARPADYALLLLLATLWGASYTFIKLGVETIPPVTLIAARTAIAAVLLLCVLRWRGIAMPRDGATWRQFVIQSALSNVIPFVLIAWAVQSVDAGLATILNSTSPIFTFLMAWFLARNSSLVVPGNSSFVVPGNSSFVVPGNSNFVVPGNSSFVVPGLTRDPVGRQLFGVISGMIGISLIVGVQALSGLGQQLLAQLTLVFAAVCYAGAAIFGRNFQGLDPMLPATGSLLCGALMLVPLSLVIDQPWTLAPSARSVAALVCLAVFSTALALTIYFRLLQTLGSVNTTSQAYLRVPIGVGIGVVFLGETLASTTWVGLGCVVVGVAVMTLQAKTRQSL